MKTITRDEAFTLLKKYNKDSFHIQHALTVEAVMKWYANELGYGEDAEYWGIVGLLHDIDFELYPEEHCLKAPEMLREAGVGEDVIHSVVSHGYGITVGCGATIDVAPEHEMEKVLFAADELTGLIWAAALMRPSKSTKDMELKSLKKKYKSKGFAAGCSREVIERGAEQLGWELQKLLTMTLQAMADCEDEIKVETLATMSWLYVAGNSGDEGEAQIVCKDADGNPLTEEAYQQYAQTYFKKQGYTEDTLLLRWTI